MGMGALRARNDRLCVELRTLFRIKTSVRTMSRMFDYFYMALVNLREPANPIYKPNVRSLAYLFIACGTE